MANIRRLFKRKAKIEKTKEMKKQEGVKIGKGKAELMGGNKIGKVK